MSEWEVVGKVKKPETDGWEAVGNAPQSQPNQPGLMQRIGQDWGKRGESIRETTTDFSQGKIMRGTAALQFLGQVAGGAIDATAQTLGEVTPDFMKQWLKEEMGANKADIDAFMKTPLGEKSADLAGYIAEKYDEFKTSQPQMAKTFESAGNIALVAAPFAKGKPKVQLWDQPEKKLLEAVKPYPNQANTAMMLDDGRLVAGGRTKTKFVQTDAVKRQVDALKTVKGIGAYQSSIKRHELVNQEIINASEALTQRLSALSEKGKYIKSPSMPVLKKEIKRRFNKGRELSEQMTDAEATRYAKDIKHRLTKATERADGNLNIADVHEQRKLLDHRYRNKKNENRFTGKNETAEERIWKIKRDILNDAVDKAAPFTKNERSRIAALYDVREILKVKATKGQLYWYQDVADKVPLMGATKTKLLPRGGR